MSNMLVNLFLNLQVSPVVMERRSTCSTAAHQCHDPHALHVPCGASRVQLGGGVSAGRGGGGEGGGGG